MPRVENLGKNVSEWCEKTGEGSTAHDVCILCWERLEVNPLEGKLRLKPEGTGEPMGEDGWSGDVEHPPYELEPTKCAICKKPLDYADNDGVYL